MADPINATQILAQAQQDAVIDAAPTDQSLNAGAFLPSEPIPDVLTNEVEADASTIRDALTKLNDEQVVSQESNYNALAYLKQDMLNQRGINQRLAAEAMQLVPNFAKGKPLNYFSKHTSQTGFQLAMESIEDALTEDVVGLLKEQAQRLNAGAMPEALTFLKNIDFKRRADQVDMQGNILADFIKVTTNNGFNWDDSCFQGCAKDKSQNTAVPVTLLMETDRVQAFSLRSMDEYYMTHLQGPALVEYMTLYLSAWKDAFQCAIDAITSGDECQPEIPQAPKITFAGGKSVSIEDAYQVFRDGYENQKHEFDNLTTQQWVSGVASAAEQAKVEDIIARLGDYYAVRDALGGTVTQLASLLEEKQPDTEHARKLAEKFTEVVNCMNRNTGELERFCVNASLATTYASALAIKVLEHAWISVNQCKDTLQMDEADYQNLKFMVEDVQGPKVTGVTL